MANKTIPQLDPVVTAAQTDKFIVRQSGDFEDKHVDMSVMQLALQITESQITDLQAYLLDITSEPIGDLFDVFESSPADRHVLVYDSGDSRYENRLLVEADISDLQSYLTAEVNDLTAAVTWDNIPDANVPQSAVTQHQAALSITESQISDLQAYLLDITGEPVGDLSDVFNSTPADRHVLVYDGVTDNRYENRLLVEADISDLQSYLTAEVNDLTAAVTWDNIPDANVPQSAVTQHEAALTITESQISDLQHTVGVSGLGIWKYRTETTTPPASGQIRFNNADISSATEFYLHETNDGSVDVSAFLELLLQDGSVLYVQDRSNAANFVVIEISSSTDNGTYRTYGIQSIVEQGTEPSNNSDVILLTSGVASAGGGTLELVDLQDVNSSTPTNRNVLVADGVDWESRALVEADISDLQSYLTAEVNDLSAAVTWVNVPDANITQSSVTQHVAAIDHDQLLNFDSAEHFTQAAISITESQISDLGAYLENVVEDTTPQLGGDLDTNGNDIINGSAVTLPLLIQAGTDGTNNGGTLTLRAGASGGSSTKGGSVLIEATNGAGGGAEGGDVTITCGNANGSGDDGGDFLAMAGAGVGGGGNGGNATVEGGTSNGSGVGGFASLVGGQGNNGTGTGGVARVIGGLGGDNGGDGGDAEVTGGAGVSAGSDGDGGDVVITGGAGAGTGADGSVILAVVGGTNIVFNPTTGRLEQGAETFAYQSEATGDVTKVGTPVNNQIGVWTGDGTLEGDANFTWDGTVVEVTGGSSSGYRTSQAAGPMMVNLPASDTTPTLVPNRGDLDTGVGSAQVDNLSLIAGGVQALRLKEASGGVLFIPQTDQGITAWAGGGQGNLFLDSTYNVISTVATTGDSVTLPAVFNVNALVFIKNDGANACDVFPALGDDLGAGVNTAISLAAGESASFIATVASSTWTPWIVDTGGSGDVTKVGTPVDNQLGVWTGDGTIEGISTLTYDSSGGDLTVGGAVGKIKVANGNSGNPSHGFHTETNSGMYRQSAGVLGFSMLGTNAWLMRATSLDANIAGGPRMQYEASTDTNPVFCPFLGADTTGVGGVSGTVALIGSGVTLAKTVAAASGGLQANNTATGAGLERVLTTSDLVTAQAANDAVQARRTSVLTLTTAYVDVTMDATDVETDSAVIEHDNTNTDDIDIKVTGTYEISYDADVETAETSGSLLITMDGRVRVNDTTVLDGSDARAGSARDTSLDGEHFQNHLSCSFIADLSAGDFVTLQLRKTELAGAGSGQFDSIRQSLKVKRLL